LFAKGKCDPHEKLVGFNSQFKNVKYLRKSVKLITMLTKYIFKVDVSP
jgi:hypothetical protein